MAGQDPGKRLYLLGIVCSEIIGFSNILIDVEQFEFPITMMIDKLPWTLEAFCGFRQLIFGVIVLSKASLRIAALAAIVSTAGLTLNNVNPLSHRHP